MTSRQVNSFQANSRSALRIPLIKNVRLLAGSKDSRENTPWFRGMGRALTHRNFRLFFFGQGISVVGTWMQQVAVIWLVYRLSGSAFLLGFAGFASQIPAALAAPVAGVLTDRWNRRRTVLATQWLSMLQAFAMMTLTYFGWINVWLVIFLSIGLGLVNAFDMPARQSFVIEMVECPGDLANAIALNSSMFNAARLIGPAIAGCVIGWLGEWPCFLLNGLSYFAVVGSLMAMRVKPVQRSAAKTSILDGLKEGLGYISGSLPIRSVLLLLGVISMMSMPLTVLMPVVATEILHGGPRMLGLLTTSMGFGALCASLFLAARKNVVGLGSLIAWSSGIFGVGMAVLSCSHHFWLSMAVLFIIGFAMVAETAASNTILQTIVEDDKRGRVMSFYAMAFVGMAPLGSLLSGGLAGQYGVLAAILICGLVCIACSLLFMSMLPSIRQAVEPIYLRAGILQGKELVSGSDMGCDDSLLDAPNILPFPNASIASPALERSAA